MAAAVTLTEGASASRPRSSRAPLLIVGLSVAWIVMITIFCLVGSAIAPYSAVAQNLSIGMAGPTAQHWLGTDALGRDVLSIIIVGARTAVIGPAIIAVVSMTIGSALGLLAGYYGGHTDTVIMRWADVMYALPGLIVAIVVVGVTGGGYWLAVLVITILSIPYDARIVRAATLDQRGRPYVEAAKLLGVRDRVLLARHIFPNVLPIELANAFLTFAFSLVTLASLSFLGLGVPPGTPDWGRLLADSYERLSDNALASIAPGVMLVLTAASASIVGDWLYERLSDRGRAR
jgi:peptide/nickel transport system permease protein